MRIEVFVYIMIAITLCYSMGLIFVKPRGRPKLSKVLTKKLKLKSGENVLNGTGFYLSIGMYNTIRMIVILFLLILSVISFSFLYGVIAIVLAIISHPQELLADQIKTPFYFVCNQIRQYEKDKKDDELIVSIAILKNLIVSLGKYEFGAQFIIEQLARTTNLTRQAFMKLLRLMQLGKDEEARDAFVEDIGSDLSKFVATLLVSIDKNSPAEINELITSQQGYVQTLRLTRQKKKNELLSDVGFLLAVICSFLVFMNYVIVAFVLERQAIFEMIL